MKESNKIIDQVRQLIEAENKKDRNKAAPILSENFIAINRSDGREQNRDDLLNEIADPNRPDINRELANAVDIVPQSQEIAVIRSLVKVAVPKQFRNTHVFVNEKGQWRCISWQVTEQK
jgi:hypothetical protein